MSEPLAWPPKREDLARFYLEDKLSAAKIAVRYGVRYKSPKVAESTILYELRKNGIQRRSRTEHIAKVTSEMVDGWVVRYVGGESLKQIAADKVSPVTVFLHLKKRGVKLRNKVDAQIKALTKHERRPFAGDPLERAYLIGFRYGDLHVMPHGRAIRVKVSTTHPAMVELFRNLFSPYGHVYQYPRRSDLTGYEWSLDCDLDDSFSFLLDPRKELDAILGSTSLFPLFLAGFFDAEGSIYLHRKKKWAAFEVSIANLNEDLLRKISMTLRKDGYNSKIRLSKQSPNRGLGGESDRICRLSIWRYAEVKRLVASIRFRNPEKIAKGLFVPRLDFRTPEDRRKLIVSEWNEMIGRIKRNRDDYIEEARMRLLSGKAPQNELSGPLPQASN